MNIEILVSPSQRCHITFFVLQQCRRTRLKIFLFSQVVFYILFWVKIKLIQKKSGFRVITVYLMQLIFDPISIVEGLTFRSTKLKLPCHHYYQPLRYQNYRTRWCGRWGRRRKGGGSVVRWALSAGGAAPRVVSEGTVPWAQSDDSCPAVSPAVVAHADAADSGLLRPVRAEPAAG